MVEHRGDVLDGTFGALGHRVRREMLERLRRGEVRVTELAAPFDMSLAAASKHVRVLEAAGLIHRHVIGREHRLSLEPHPLMAASSWIDTYRAFWEGRLDALESHLRTGGDR
ncbi:MAG: ArsR/SmtB family transcription factor [Actinomycetota bacterium]